MVVNESLDYDCCCEYTGWTGCPAHAHLPEPGDNTVTETIETTVQDELRSYNTLEQQVLRAEEQARDLNALLRDAEQRVIEAFYHDPEQGPMVYAGRRWSVEDKTYVTPTDEFCTQGVVEWIKVSGGAALVTPTMHHASRDKFLRETVLDDDDNATVPDELLGLVKVTRILKLKATKVAGS